MNQLDSGMRDPMKARLIQLSASVALAGLALPAAASSISGNPLADGWAHQGDSLDAGTYVRGSGGYDFGIYTSSFSLGGGSNLLGSGWQAGHSVLGVGGVVNDLGSNISRSLRIVTKFGTDPASWSPATEGGQGSLSAGHGGDGAILLGTYSPADASSGGHFNPGTALNYLSPGTVHEMPLAQRYDSGSTSSINTNIGKLLFTFDANNYLASWQVILNLSLLEAELPGGSILPSDADRIIQTLQRSNNSTQFTDGLGGFDTAAVVIPLPTGAGLAALGLGMIALRRRR